MDVSINLLNVAIVTVRAMTHELVPDRFELGSVILYCSFAYSALASLKMGMSGSASFQSVRKSL